MIRNIILALVLALSAIGAHVHSQSLEKGWVMDERWNALEGRWALLPLSVNIEDRRGL